MNGSVPTPRPNRIALIGTCVPRQCGIATFTNDLQQALGGADPAMAAMTIAMTDDKNVYAYPDQVPLEIHQADPTSYEVAADFLNVADIEIVSLQHEFGIFGGEAGEHILGLVRGLRAPLVTTLHTVLASPNPAQRRVMDELIASSARLVVMADKGREILQDVYGVPADHIAVIPHGVPDRPFLDPAMAKHDLDLADRTLLMTFGLLGPGKGIETAIRALPVLVQDNPKLLYMIVGATHPNLVRDEGERYRESLAALANKLGVGDHVQFVDRYLSLDELLDYLAACDIYLSPYPNEAQIASGTLAYAIALGKAVVSTPFWYAQELLADDCGLLVPFGQADGFATAVRRLIYDDALRSEIRTNAYARGRAMIWPRVAEQYLEVFSAVRLERRSTGATIIPVPLLEPADAPLPPVSTVHLAALTDSVGLIQHTKFAVPDRRHGYCLDDNARALLVLTELAALRPLTAQEEQLHLTYAAFVESAWSPRTNQVHNFMSYDRTWVEGDGADDALGRTIWALGAVARHKDTRSLDGWAATRVLEIAPFLLACTSPRAWAYGLLGISRFLQRFPGHRGFERLRGELGDRLFQRWSDAALPDWVWFEDRLGYDNARLCEALIVSGHDTGTRLHLEAGLDALQWLIKLQTAKDGHFRPIGTETFGTDHRQPQPFDQQPLEAWAAVSACMTAANVTGNPVWHGEASRAFAWFLGENDLHVPVVDIERGACFDGLHPDRRNANQGAESTLAYLSALTAILNATKQHCPLREAVRGTKVSTTGRFSVGDAGSAPSTAISADQELVLAIPG
jgi:glycosyltransferase involved in cell wall biosynthesis